MCKYTCDVKFLTAGECGLVIKFGNIISPEVNKFVQHLTRRIHDEATAGIIEAVPAYCSVMVHFDPLVVTRRMLTVYLTELIAGLEPQKLEGLQSRLVRIPVCYGGVLGPDLEYVARYTGLAAEKVVELHTARPYLVYMLGFTPGFPYLGSLSDRLIIPRKEKPLLRVPAGSVGITGNQTGVYPSESQGEWWLIGRTPLKTVDLASSRFSLVAPGDYVQFFEVDLEEYFQIRKKVAQGQYIPQVSPYVTEGEFL